MSERVKMPGWLAMSRVLENLGWKRSRVGPGLKGTLFTILGTDRKSKTCSAICAINCAHVCIWRCIPRQLTHCQS